VAKFVRVVRRITEDEFEDYKEREKGDHRELLRQIQELRDEVTALSGRLRERGLLESDE
jgi:hypothetical protein